MDIDLGTLEKVSIRDIWKNEEKDFTPWLADSLELLGETIGLDISDPETEVSVGSFSADIVAQTEDGEKIVIENQFGKTDHDHLGKLITYASGIDAKYIVWIFEEKMREEHRQAIDWLNSKTDSTLNIFAVQIEVWRIGNSEPAPTFQMVCKPNEWAKEVKQTSSNTKPTKGRIFYTAFWEGFNLYIDKNKLVISRRTVAGDHWFVIFSHSVVDTLSSEISLSASYTKSFVMVKVNTDKDLFSVLFDKKEQIEKELALNLNWRELPNNKYSKIEIVKEIEFKDIENFNEANYQEHYKWFADMGLKFRDVFKKYI